MIGRDHAVGTGETFEVALKHLLKWEGGYVDHPRDPGGETNFGISKRSYPDLDIRNLSRAEAAAIYRRDYWRLCKCDRLPDGLAIALFDSAVNQGPAPARKMLQKALGVPADGVIGPKTVAKAATSNKRDVLASFMARRIIRYAWHKAWRTFGLGWMRRVIDCAIECAPFIED